MHIQFMRQWYLTSSIVHVHNGSEETNNVLAHTVQVHVDDLSDLPSNLAVSRNWMECIEFKNSEGPGAYEVLRCDLIKKQEAPTTCKVWGQDFHLKRLEASYEELDPSVTDICRKAAHEQSDIILKSLVSKMLECEERSLNHDAAVNEHGTVCEIVRITLLWTPCHPSTSTSGSEGITVRGHASTTGDIMIPTQIPTEIVVTLALPRDESVMLPDRPKPHAKISSWSRERRSLEDTQSFMPDGVSEVLLLHPIQSVDRGGENTNTSTSTSTSIQKSYEILEGMTSNFFAIYRDGTIRTAQDGILFGYVRHLVMDCATDCGLTIDSSSRPIDLKDGEDGLWAETFITSSSRLIHPVKRILIPDYTRNSISEEGGALGRSKDVDSQGVPEGLRWKVFWEVDRLDVEEYKWYHLLQEILKRGGYSRDECE